MSKKMSDKKVVGYTYITFALLIVLLSIYLPNPLLFIFVWLTSGFPTLLLIWAIDKKFFQKRLEGAG